MLKTTLTIRDHKFAQPEHVRQSIAKFLAESSNGLYELILKRVSDRRTSRQNRYLWKLCEILAEHIGYGTSDHGKELVLADCMERLGMGQYVRVLGRERFLRDSTALKDREKFGKIIDELHRIADILNEDIEPDRHIILPSREEGLQ